MQLKTHILVNHTDIYEGIEAQASDDEDFNMRTNIKYHKIKARQQRINIKIRKEKKRKEMK